jgi:hypothetical protein
MPPDHRHAQTVPNLLLNVNSTPLAMMKKMRRNDQGVSDPGLALAGMRRAVHRTFPVFGRCYINSKGCYLIELNRDLRREIVWTSKIEVPREF